MISVDFDNDIIVDLGVGGGGDTDKMGLKGQRFKL